ncbi:MAG: anaerobic ribonucleoside-triphosphate reductase activating protein [Clostridiaceae bacterium]|jgi:anaerobic ribonucleoside-triphosphate reductase activating protein|nr:anaerobic ribonucleoside-triphosphate reductase activating protein [Clostridiaceae bacterium]
MELRAAGIVKESVVDGPGFRYVIFAQGCNHCCKGCHNPDTHELDGGYIVDTDSLIEDIKSSRYIDGVTFSGGEPFLQAEAFIHIAEKLREAGMNIICYTGFTYEELTGSGDESRIKLLGLIDVLIDGPYIEGLKDLGLSYRGSGNQRIIDVKSSLGEQRIVIEPM